MPDIRRSFWANQRYIPAAPTLRKGSCQPARQVHDAAENLLWCAVLLAAYYAQAVGHGATGGLGELVLELEVYLLAVGEAALGHF